MCARLVVIGSAIAALLQASAAQTAPPAPQERQEQAPAKAPGTIPPERRIFVPIWTESAPADRSIPATARREPANVVWTAVPLPATRVLPAFQPQGTQATLVEFRRSTSSSPGVPERPLVAVIRTAPAPDGARPFLEILDRGTLLRSAGWGRLLRKTPETTEWIFTIPDPIPPRPGEKNPVSARVAMGPLPNRSFELRLVSDVPQARQAR